MKFSQCIRTEQSRAEVCNLSVNLSREKNKLKELRAARAIQSWIVGIVYPPNKLENLAPAVRETVPGKLCHRKSIEFLTFKNITSGFRHTDIHLSLEVRNLGI